MVSLKIGGRGAKLGTFSLLTVTEILEIDAKNTVILAFDTLRYATLETMAYHRTRNAGVTGSSPAAGIFVVIAKIVTCIHM